MKNWAYFLLTVAAVGAATVVASVAWRRHRRTAELNEIPDIIDDCFKRIQSIERELRHLKPAPAPDPAG
jgi:hypothetical protein